MRDGDDGERRRNEFQGTVFGPVVQVGSVQGDVNLRASPRLPAPAQLRAQPAHFTNRESELLALRVVSDGIEDHGHPRLAVITGSGGVGKTSLGLCWLNQVRDRFEDGQLFADLRGFSGAEPVQPSEPLEGFLRALGVPTENIPVAVEEQAALYRSVTAGRRLIIFPPPPA